MCAVDSMHDGNGGGDGDGIDWWMGFVCYIPQQFIYYVSFKIYFGFKLAAKSTDSIRARTHKLTHSNKR